MIRRSVVPISCLLLVACTPPATRPPLRITQAAGPQAPGGLTSRPTLPVDAGGPPAAPIAGSGAAAPADGGVPGAAAPPIDVPPPRRRGHDDDVLPTLAGLLSAPARVVSNNGGTLISNNGAMLVSGGGGNLITGAGSLVSGGGGNLVTDGDASLLVNAGVVSNGGASYRLAEVAGADRALTNTFMYLTNRDERFHVRTTDGRVFAATSDDQGGYAFPADGREGFPFGKDVIVNAFVNPDLRLTGLAFPRIGDLSLDVDLATTLATELLREDAYRAGRSLAAYDLDAFRTATDRTRDAIRTGAIAATVPIDGGEAGRFDLRIAQTPRLRSQYLVSFSVAAVGDAVLRAVSDAWKAVLGERPYAVTTALGNGADPTVGGETGDGPPGDRPPLTGIALGGCTDVATSLRGDVFVAAYNPYGNQDVRWVAPDGTVRTFENLGVWIQGMRVEKTPTATEPGALLLSDTSLCLVYRVFFTDAPGVSPYQGYEVLAGNPDLAVAENPNFVDGPLPDETGTGSGDDNATPLRSRWRLAEEGVRRYLDGTDVPGPARFARLNNPMDVETDERGNVYVADFNNHRVRVIAGPGGAGLAQFGYRAPLDGDGDGLVDGLGAPAPMAAGALYTIGGAPVWDPAVPLNVNGLWRGEFADPAPGGTAQEARFDRPAGLAFRDGWLYVADLDNQRIRRISRETGAIETVAGLPPGPPETVQGDVHYPQGIEGDDGPALAAQLAFPRAIRFDAAGRLLIMDSASGRVRRIDADGTMRGVAGRKRPLEETRGAFAGDAEARHRSEFYRAWRLAVDPQGNVLVADETARRLRKVWTQWD